MSKLVKIQEQEKLTNKFLPFSFPTVLETERGQLFAQHYPEEIQQSLEEEAEEEEETLKKKKNRRSILFIKHHLLKFFTSFYFSCLCRIRVSETD